MMKSRVILLLTALLGSALEAGTFTIGPDYRRPAVEIPDDFKAEPAWKTGEPLDHLPKGRWWEIFRDPELNALEKQAMRANPDLKAAFAAVNQARAAARVARSELPPNLDLNPGYRRERLSPNQEPSFGGITTSTFRIPLDLSYEVDLWGRVRRGLEGARAEAAAREAAFQNVMLTLQADLARTYFSLRALDSEIAVLERTVELRAEQVRIISGRFESGLGAELDVARANAELAAAESELAALNSRRVELENALAILIGESPSSFRLAAEKDAERFPRIDPPRVPAGLPSHLLERRPDVAEAERLLAADNARIGVAKAAFFPVIRLTGSGGFLSAEFEALWNWESRVWSIGPSVSLPIFAGGRNKANLDRARAKFEESLARYRQRVLLAFGEVENALAGIHWLARQAEAREIAFTNAQRARELAVESFNAGLTEYLSVIDADRTALQHHRARLQTANLRLIATVQLIKALGGGWDSPASNGQPLPGSSG